MDDRLLTLGMFVFGLPALAYDELARDAAWRWGTNERYGARDAAQYLGPGNETIRLAGRLVPEIAGAYSDIDTLREMAASGEAWPMVLGTGEALGDFRIDRIGEQWRAIIGDGRPRVIDFTIELTRVEG